MNSLREWKRLLLVLLALAFGLAFAPGAHAADRVTLKDGTVLEGSIVREAAGMVWIRVVVGGKEEERLVTPEEVKTIERDVAQASAPAGGQAGGQAAQPATTTAAPAATPAGGAGAAGAAAGAAARPFIPGAPKAVVITLGERGDKDMVGLYMTVHQLREILPMLEEDLGTDGSGIVVFRITSGGGLALEVEPLTQYIHTEYKKRFRVVSWIDSAISAAAMTAHVMEEIYFTPQGNYGAATMWSGALQASEGFPLERALFLMERVSAQGGHDPLLMRSMQIPDPLSATLNSDGTVKFFADEKSGEILLNPAGRILTLNATTAQQIRFSRGTARTLDELTEQMGYKELNWVGENVAGVLWPVSRAERWSMKYRDQVHRDNEEFGKNWRLFQEQVARATATQDMTERGRWVGMARRTLSRIRQAVDTNPNFALMNFGMFPDEFEEWYRDSDDQLRQLMRPR